LDPPDFVTRGPPAEPFFDGSGVRMRDTAIGRDDTLELRLKALGLPSFHERYLELVERARKLNIAAKLDELSK
jgi:hypothetical protein